MSMLLVKIKCPMIETRLRSFLAPKYSHARLCNHTTHFFDRWSVATLTVHHHHHHLPTPNTSPRPSGAVFNTLNSSLESSRRSSKPHIDDNDTVTAGSIEQNLQWIVRGSKTFDTTVSWLVSFGALITTYFKHSPSSPFYLDVGAWDHLTIWPKLFSVWYSTRRSTTVWTKTLRERP